MSPLVLFIPLRYEPLRLVHEIIHRNICRLYHRCSPYLPTEHCTKRCTRNKCTFRWFHSHSVSCWHAVLSSHSTLQDSFAPLYPLGFSLAKTFSQKGSSRNGNWINSTCCSTPVPPPFYSCHPFGFGPRAVISYLAFLRPTIYHGLVPMQLSYHKAITLPSPCFHCSFSMVSPISAKTCLHFPFFHWYRLSRIPLRVW